MKSVTNTTMDHCSEIEECQNYGLEFDILFNSSKSAVMFLSHI